MTHRGTMHDIFRTLLIQPSTFLGRIAADPARLMTVAEWWYEMEEPIAHLSDSQAAFVDDERRLLKLCSDHSIPYRDAGDGRSVAFPAWLFLTIAANP